MDGGGPTITRGSNGRFLPGVSGNPAGKKPGTRNRATVLRDALDDGEAAGVARVVIDKALAGDAVAARFLLDRLEPKPRGRPIQLDLPKGESAAADVVALFNSALRALAAGEITPAEAVEVSRFLEGRYRVLRAWQLEEKLTRWNDPLPVPGDRFVPEGVAERVGNPLKKKHPAALRTPPSSPLPLRERVAQGWRGRAEPYPELGEGCASAGETASSSPLGERIEERGSRRVSMLSSGDSPAETPPLPSLSPRGEGYAIPDDLAIAVRDRLLTIPGVREVAAELRLLPGDRLHSACTSSISGPSIAEPSTRPPLHQRPPLGKISGNQHP